MGESIPQDMRQHAASLLRGLDAERSTEASRPFADEGARRWIEYRPEPRPGVSLADLDGAGRKAAHRLLGSALSTHAFAQAATVMALEEVLDRVEGGRRGRHSDDYRVTVFGDPEPDGRWGWRFEGHHISVSVTLDGELVSAGPVFLGANPAATSYAGRPVLRPLAPEEDLARALLDALGPRERGLAVVADTAPADILSATGPQAPDRIEPLGVPATALGATARALLDQLLAVYLDRLRPELAAAEAARLRTADLHFAWAGGLRPGSGHYYRIQGPDLLVEYDNTQNGANHAHTVLRRPHSDFGDDVLARHRGGRRLD
jgi:hypothetical protein